MALDPRERFSDLEEALRMALRAERATIWTTMPGTVVSFDPDAVTAVVQLTIQGVVAKSDGSADAVNLPQLLDVPVVFPRGGGVTLTFPIAADDECLVHFSARCIDGWWQSGGVQLPMDTRMHDLSDGFCVVGPQSQVNKITGISTTTAQLRTDDGQAFIELDPESHAVNTTTTGDVSVTAGGDLSADITGDMSVTVGGDLTADVTGSATVDVTGDLTASAATADVTAASITLRGSVHVIGTLDVTGLASLNGGFGALPRAGGGKNTISSDVEITGHTKLGSVEQGGKDIGGAHQHPNGGGGSPTGGVI